MLAQLGRRGTHAGAGSRINWGPRLTPPSRTRTPLEHLTESLLARLHLHRRALHRVRETRVRAPQARGPLALDVRTPQLGVRLRDDVLDELPRDYGRAEEGRHRVDDGAVLEEAATLDEDVDKDDRAEHHVDPDENRCEQVVPPRVEVAIDGPPRRPEATDRGARVKLLLLVLQDGRVAVGLLHAGERDREGDGDRCKQGDEDVGVPDHLGDHDDEDADALVEGDVLEEDDKDTDRLEREHHDVDIVARARDVIGLLVRDLHRHACEHRHQQHEGG
eukprot:382447-Prymnesium_polylepis.2